MVSINGAIYIITGGAVAFGSYLVNRSTNANYMTVFMFVGFAFVVIGLVKLVVHKLGHSEEHKKPHVQNNMHHAHHNQHAHNQQAHPNQHVHSHGREGHQGAYAHTIHQQSQHPPIVVCSSCHTRQHNVTGRCAHCNQPL